MAAPVHQSDSSSTGSGTTFTPTKPAGTATGDLLLLHVSYEKGSDVTVTSSQWTTEEDETQAANVGQRVARRIEDGAALTAVTFSQSVAFSWTVSRITGHDASTPIDGKLGANSASGNPDPPSVTPTVVDTLAYAVCSAKTQTTYTPPSGYAEQWDNPNSTSGTPSQSGATKTLTTTSAENPGTFTPAAASEWVAATVLIRPTAGVDFPLTADLGAFALTGTSSTPVTTRLLSSDFGPYALTGTTADLIYSGDLPDVPHPPPGTFDPELVPESWF